MYDVIGAYQRIDYIYKLYIRSAFPLRYPALAEEREKILHDSSLLSQPPLIEPVPVYQSSGKTLSQAAQDLTGYEDLASLGQTLFPPNLELYQHQWESLEAVLKNQQDLLKLPLGFPIVISTKRILKPGEKGIGMVYDFWTYITVKH